MKKIFSKFFKSTYIIILFVTLCIVSVILWNKNLMNASVAENNEATSNEFSQEQWLEDINFFENALIQKHPDLYRNIEKEDFHKEIEALKKDVVKLSDLEVTMKLVQITASIEDAHTYMRINQEGRVYPIVSRWFGNELYVGAADKSYSEVMGTKLISINNIPIKEISQEINTLIPHDTDQFIKAQNPDFIIWADALKYFNFIDSDEVLFTFKDDRGTIIDINMKPSTITRENAVSYRLNVPKKPIKWLRGEDDFWGYWYKYIPEDKILYFQYNMCQDKYSTSAANKDISHMLPDFQVFLEELKEIIDKNNIDKFIIDMRQNYGGDHKLLNPLIDILKNNKNLNRKGNLFVLIGRETYSAAVWNSVDLKNKTEAIFIGEPTGGKVNMLGNTVKVTLPNSKLSLIIPTANHFLSNKYKDSFYPDIIIEESFDNYKNGVDEVYEMIKNHEIN